jgi:hypothetical protein
MGTARLIALIFLAIGLYFLGHDAANLITGRAAPLEALGALWYRLDPASLNGLQGFIQRLSPELWDPGFTTLLKLPSWALPLFIGLVVLAGDIFSQRRGKRS